jgi:hypothetical protein
MSTTTFQLWPSSSGWTSHTLGTHQIVDSTRFWLAVSFAKGKGLLKKTTPTLVLHSAERLLVDVALRSLQPALPVSLSFLTLLEHLGKTWP